VSRPARPASSSARWRAASAWASLRAIASDAFALSAFGFAFSISFSAESTSLFGDSSAEVRGEAGFRPAPGGTIGLDGEDGGGERSCGFLRHARTPHSKAPTRFFFDFQSSSFSDLTRERVKDGRHFTVVRILLAG
jgi:hypothetical protein